MKSELWFSYDRRTLRLPGECPVWLLQALAVFAVAVVFAAVGVALGAAVAWWWPS
jgi:hypothetical protein